MTLSAGRLVEAARDETSLEDFGGDTYREGLERLVEALAGEAELTPLGEEILGMRLRSHLVSRLRVRDMVLAHPEIEAEPITSPIFIIGLPRTGTTALSNLLHADPAIRSLRMWESSDPVPPPEAATEHSDPRIAAAEEGLATMDSVFPRMRSLHFQSATGPTECQDLLGMEFRTTHFDGMAHVPSYTAWALQCDMTPAYQWHRRTLQLLQWHCPPRQWHLKTPVHMLSLPALSAVYPDARFIWTHRDPAEVMGSVCSLIAYVRSWASDLAPTGIGPEQTAIWCEALRRAMSFRDEADPSRFADVSFADLHADPVGTVGGALVALGLPFSNASRHAVQGWAEDHAAGSEGRHEFTLEEFDLTADGVRAEFGFYLERFGPQATARPS
jgi:hypothetical protein